MTGYKLQACPICDWRYPIVWHDLIERYFRVKCECCGSHTAAFPSEQAAMDAWNENELEV
jgi:hypothetical protein